MCQIHFEGGDVHGTIYKNRYISIGILHTTYLFSLLNPIQRKTRPQKPRFSFGIMHMKRFKNRAFALRFNYIAIRYNLSIFSFRQIVKNVAVKNSHKQQIRHIFNDAQDSRQ